MTNSGDPKKAGQLPAHGAKSQDRKAREARALRENLKRRKEQVKAREKSGK